MGRGGGLRRASDVGERGPVSIGGIRAQAARQAQEHRCRRVVVLLRLRLHEPAKECEPGGQLGATREHLDDPTSRSDPRVGEGALRQVLPGLAQELVRVCLGRVDGGFLY